MEETSSIRTNGEEADETGNQASGEVDGPVDDSPEEEDDCPFLIVDVEKRQSRKRIRKLRRGEGPLAEKLFDVLEQLHAEGYIGDEVLPVVFVVREKQRPGDDG